MSGAKRSRLERISWFGLIVLMALWLLEIGIGERLWPVLLLTYLPQQPLIAPTLLLLVITIWKRDWRALMLNAASLLFFLWSFGGVHLPLLHSARQALSAPPPSTPQLRVMTLNLKRGERGVPALIRAIREQNPDVICLQETRRWPEERTLYRELRAELRDYAATNTHEVAILSRYPVLGQRVIPLRNTSERAILETTIGFAGRRARIFSTHVSAIDPTLFAPSVWRYTRGAIGWQREWRRAQIETLLAQATRDDQPTIICGDFNTPPRGRLYRSLKTHFADVFAVAGWGTGNSFSSQWPLLRIDYIWVSRHWRIERCFTADSRASDHRAVVADFTLP